MHKSILGNVTTRVDGEITKNSILFNKQNIGFVKVYTMPSSTEINWYYNIENKPYSTKPPITGELERILGSFSFVELLEKLNNISPEEFSFIEQNEQPYLDLYNGLLSTISSWIQKELEGIGDRITTQYIRTFTDFHWNFSSKSVDEFSSIPLLEKGLLEVLERRKYFSTRPVSEKRIDEYYLAFYDKIMEIVPEGVRDHYRPIYVAFEGQNKVQSERPGMYICDFMH